MKQDHVHKYETILHHGVTYELTELGVESAELRRCSECQKETVFVMINKGAKKGEWFPVIDETTTPDTDILLA
jgi:hypothetical protein